MAYGKIIQRLRNSRKMNLVQFAKFVGSSKSHIQRLENEASSVGGGLKLTPSVDTLKQICVACDYPFRQFLEEAGYIEPVGQNIIDIAPPIPQNVIDLWAKLDADGKDEVINYMESLVNTRVKTE